MDFPHCHSRAIYDDAKSLFYCAHTRVHVPNGLVFPALCHACTRRLEPEPKVKRTAPPTRINSSVIESVLSQVAVVIPCHNYGEFLGEALESVLTQSTKVQEILVLNDGSTDNTESVARDFAGRGVRLLNINVKNVHEARRIGMENTISPVICFLDADDWLPPNYITSGLREFSRQRNVGIVHSDLQCFGASSRKLEFPRSVDYWDNLAKNQIHAGSLVRRDALMLSSAFDSVLPADVSCLTGDWWIWNCVLQNGWKSVCQSEAYLYRRHANSASQSANQSRTYFDIAHLGVERVTLFIPLSGRKNLWGRMCDFLDRQQWPRDQVELVMLDTSGDTCYSQRVRKWLADCDYPDVRYICQRVGAIGLADLPRIEAATEVRRTMARIYNLLARTLNTRFVWVLEDDVFPPLDACEKLLREFDENTGSVAIPYKSRFHDGFVAWDQFQRGYQNRGKGVQTIGGNGFGCVMIRGELLSNSVFTASIPHPDFDHQFYSELRQTHWQAKMHWEITAEHLDDVAEHNSTSQTRAPRAPQQ